MLLAGSQVPAQRTLLMLAVAALGLWLARPGTASMVWLWALAIVVAWDPWAGVTPGFWLSFGSVGLLLYAHVGRLAVATRNIAPRARLARVLRVAARTQALVTVGLVPMTLALFQQVSLISPLANALAIPVVTFAVVPLALAGIVLPLDVLWQGAHAVFAAMMVPLLWLAQLPGAVWQQHAPAALGGGCRADRRRLARRAARRPGPRARRRLVRCRCSCSMPPRPDPGAFRMTVLDVGQGLAVVVQTHRHTLLYDTGPRYTDEADAGGRIVAPFLRAAGIARLGAMIVSHQDSDHSGGAATLLQTVPVDWLLSSLPYDHDLLAEWARGGRHRVALRGRAALGVGRRALHRPASAGLVLRTTPRLKTNDLSCVVRVESVLSAARS